MIWQIVGQPIYPVAIVLAVVVSMVIGSVWYSPMLFAKQWQALTKGGAGMQKEKMMMSMMYAVFASLVEATVLQLFIVYAYVFMVFSNYQAAITAQFADSAATPMMPSMALIGAMVGFMAWAGLTATTTLINMAFQGSRKKLWLIDNGYHMLAAVGMGLVIGLVMAANAPTLF